MTDKSRVIPYRLPVEIADWLSEGISTRKVIEWLYGAVKGGKAYIKDNEVYVKNEYEEILRGVSVEQLRDIDVMCKLSGGTLAELLSDLQNRLDNCELNLVDGKIALD